MRQRTKRNRMAPPDIGIPITLDSSTLTRQDRIRMLDDIAVTARRIVIRLMH